MEKALFRTNASDLSHDQLRLLDVLFSGKAPLRCLRRDRYRVTWNQPSHELDDIALDKTVRHLCERGILEIEQLYEEAYVVLTNGGGNLWEKERCPFWDRYATERYREPKSGRPYATVVATSQSTCEDFVKFGGPCWAMTGTRVRMFEIRRHTLIYWRSFPQLFAAVVMNLEPDYPTGPDWEQRWLAYDQRRTWWRNVFELQKFLSAA